MTQRCPAALRTSGLVAYGVLNGVFYSAGIAYVMLGPMGVVPATDVGIKPAIAAAVKQLAKVCTRRAPWAIPLSVTLLCLGIR